MDILLNILFTILGLFVLVYLESFLLALFGLRLLIILFFFLFRKIQWKIFLPLLAITLFIFDVVYKLPLGSNILIFLIPFALYLVISMFVSLESGSLSYFVKLILFWLYHISLLLLPNLFLSGSLGLFVASDFLSSFLRAVFSTLILLILEYLYAGFRKRGNSSQIRLK